MIRFKAPTIRRFRKVIRFRYIPEFPSQASLSEKEKEALAPYMLTVEQTIEQIKYIRDPSKYPMPEHIRKWIEEGKPKYELRVKGGKYAKQRKNTKIGRKNHKIL